MSGFEEFKNKVNGKEFQAVILFADIMNASEISNNTSIKNYAYIINQFHKCAARVYDFIGLNNYPSNINVAEFSLRGDEVCLILHSSPLEKEGSLKEKIDRALERDVRDAIRFSIAMKLLWRATEYNQNRIRQDIFPRDLGIGIHQGTVYCYNDKELPASSNKNESSEGYSINLAKRIETESRNGNKSKILVSGSIRYWSKEKIKIPLEFEKHTPKDKLKGISTDFSIYEIINVEDEFANLIDKLIEELKFDNETWEKYELLKEKNPDDFWTELLVKFKTKIQEEKKPVFVEKKSGKEIIEKDYEFYFEEALKFYDMGNYDKTIQNLTKAIILNPEYIDAYNYRGLVYYDNSEYDKSIADYNKVIELDSDNEYNYNNRGNAYDGRGLYNEAIDDYNKAIGLNMGYAEAYNNRGSTYYHKGLYDNTIEDCTKAIDLNPKYAYAYYNRGVAYYKKYEYSKALEDYKKAISLDPTLARAYYNRGIVYIINKEYDKAIADYNKSIKLDHENSSAFCDRGYAYFEKGLYNEAIDDYNRAIKIEPKYKDAYCGLGITYYKIGNKESAKKYYQQAIELDKRYAGKIDELIKEEGMFYSEKQLQIVKELLKEMGY